MTADLGRVRDDVRSFLAEHSLVDIVSDDMNLFETGALDSMTIVELLLFLEQTFALSIQWAELDFASLSTVAAIVELVAAHEGPREVAG